MSLKGGWDPQTVHYDAPFPGGLWGSVVHRRAAGGGTEYRVDLLQYQYCGNTFLCPWSHWIPDLGHFPVLGHLVVLVQSVER